MEDYAYKQAHTVFQKQIRVIKEMAEKSHCVIVGRCADYVLRSFFPYRIFVYAYMKSKTQRCKERGSIQSELSDEQIKQNIIKIDKNRSKYYLFYLKKSRIIERIMICASIQQGFLLNKPCLFLHNCFEN